jgi:predicted signal transduction protein with EAL and GGDEF domain
MPFSEIKIDQSLIADIVREREARLIVGAIAQLAHTLEMTVCAAGVESRQAYECVRSAGIDTAQGRFFSPPVDASEVERFLKSWPRADFLTTGAWRLQHRSEYKRIATSHESSEIIAPIEAPAR